MRPAFILIALFLLFHHLFAQTVISSKDFGNSRSLLIHELSFTQGLEDGFVILKEEKKGVFNLERRNLNLEVMWESQILFDPQLNVPQLMVHKDKALVLSYTVKELERSVTIELKKVDMGSGRILAEARQAFPQYQPRSPYPRISISSDLSKIVLANYFPSTTGMPEIKILSSNDLNITKTVQLNKSIFDAPIFNRFVIDNQGNVFFVSINESLFRMDGYFIPAEGTEVRMLVNDIMFSRPMNNVPDVMIHVVEDSSQYMVAAAGNIQGELIGVKLAGYDFKNNVMSFDSTFDFSMINVLDLYQESVPASKSIKKRGLKTPLDLSGFHLQEMRVDDDKNIFLFIEKNLQKSTFQMGFNSGNLAYIYNTNIKRKLQKSEDVILLSFDPLGGKSWGRVLQKYQVTRPFNYYLSYVSDLSNNVLSILTWTKKNRHSFQITQIESTTGEIIRSGVDILNNAKYTYHKNYTTWINGNHVAITTQRNNRMKNREFHVVKIIE